jgi:hypothetical protein
VDDGSPSAHLRGGWELRAREAAFHQVFAGDLPEAQSAILGASQRPVAAAAFDEPTGVPAWKTLPS